MGSLDLAVAGAFVFEGFINPSAIGSHLLKGLEISTESLVARRAVLQTFEIGLEFERGFQGKAINHPGGMPGALNHASLAKIREMLRDLGLRNAQNFLKMADTKRTARQQMDDPQSRGVAEALINLNQLHR